MVIPPYFSAELSKKTHKKAALLPVFLLVHILCTLPNIHCFSPVFYVRMKIKRQC